MARRVTPDQARELMEKEGYVYVDVRSVPEFQAGHPTGAYNVPLNHMGPAGTSPNPDFLAAMEKSFPKDARLIVSCKAGGRSARAAAMLEGAGFTNVADQHDGFEGREGPGWRPKGLPVSQEAPADRTWEGVSAKLEKK
jgi:rhodanese-related sulfurtransferase